MNLNCKRCSGARYGCSHDRGFAARTIRPATLLLGALLAVWTAPGAAQENAESCANGVVVPEPENNPDLVADCEVLLALRDRYAEDADLEWSADTPITEWEDIVVDDFVLTELAQLARLKVLFLKNNELTGTFPTVLLAMTNLTGLSLSQNELTGGVPPELGEVTTLEGLDLDNNELTGGIPPELGNLENLTALLLHTNELTGDIRPSSGSWKTCSSCG